MTAMKKSVVIIFTLALATVFSLPISAGAATNPGIKPGSIFYFFDTTFEKIGLFFTFNPEKKARRALEYADERLAEIEAIAGEKKSNAVITAIADYENNVALATEKSKEVKDKGQAESLLASIEDNTSKNQIVLSAVLTKVPEEAKQAITQAISVSKKGQEEAVQQIAALKGEVEELKKEVAELKDKDEKREKIIEELDRQKSEVAPKTASAPEPIKPLVSQSSEVALAAKPSVIQHQTPIKTSEPQINPPIIPTKDNAAPLPLVVSSVVSPPVPTTKIEALEITSVSVTADRTSAKIEWQTNKPTSAKVFISGGGLSLKVYSSESGISTRHIVNITGLNSGTSYSYEIESIAGEQVAKQDGSLVPPAPILHPRFIGEPKVSRTYFGSAGDWNLEIHINFTDAPFVGGFCLNSNGSEVYRTNRVQDILGSDISFRIPHDSSGITWSSTYNCTFNLQDWLEGKANEIKNLPITKEFTFTTPSSPTPSPVPVPFSTPSVDDHLFVSFNTPWNGLINTSGIQGHALGILRAWSDKDVEIRKIKFKFINQLANNNYERVIYLCGGKNYEIGPCSDNSVAISGGLYWKKTLPATEKLDGELFMVLDKPLKISTANWSCFHCPIEKVVLQLEASFQNVSSGDKLIIQPVLIEWFDGASVRTDGIFPATLKPVELKK